MAQQSDNSAWDRVIQPWWAKVIIGVVMILIAISSYNDFAKLESGEKEKLSIGRSTKILYRIGGKGLAAAVPGVVGLAFVSWGIVQVAQGKK